METSLDEAKSFYQQGHFEKAEPFYARHLEQTLSSNESISADSLIETVRVLIRIYSEMEDTASLQKLANRLREHPALQLHIAQDPRFAYCMAIFHFYQGDLVKAREESRRALELATQSGSMPELANAIIQNTKMNLEPTPESAQNARAALSELENVLKHVQDPATHLAANLLEADILMAEKKTELSIEKVWKAFELAKETDCSLFFAASTIAKIGHLYLTAKDHDKAALYLNIAEKTVLPRSMVRLHKVIGNLLSKCAGSQSLYDVFLDLKKRKLFLKPDVEVDLKNQFILTDLLKLFLQSPGTVYGKKELAEQIWREEYDPTRHDNLIYVNLKRLRTLLEASPAASNLILRSKNGYYINPDSKLGIQSEEMI